MGVNVKLASSSTKRNVQSFQFQILNKFTKDSIFDLGSVKQHNLQFCVAQFCMAQW